MAGLTNVCDVVGYKKDQEGHVIPTPGKLIYRGVNINEIVDEAYRNDRFVFEEVIWLLLFGSLPTREQLDDFCEMRGHYNHDQSQENIAEKVKNSAYEIIEKKRATYYGVAMAVKRICEVIIRDEKSILPISSMMHGDFGVDNVVLSMPAVVGADCLLYTSPSPRDS